MLHLRMWPPTDLSRSIPDGFIKVQISDAMLILHLLQIRRVLYQSVSSHSVASWKKYHCECLAPTVSI